MSYDTAGLYRRRKVNNLEICLFEPGIAQNTGAIARLCACFGIHRLNIIEPASFIFDNNRSIRRAGMDYIKKIKLIRHGSFEEFRRSYTGRIVLFDVKATKMYFDIQFFESDCILLGNESFGVTDEIFSSCDERVIIPISQETRSLNVAMCAAIGLAEVARQIMVKKNPTLL
jgi:tRNA (cytidine/uridine-2'-O-)-methyltransferase